MEKSGKTVYYLDPMQSFSAMEENITLSDIDGGDVIRTSRIWYWFSSTENLLSC